MGGGTSLCVLRSSGIFRIAGAVLLAPPVVEWVQERQMLRLAERQIKNDLHRANAEGRTITGFQLCNGVPIPEYED